MDEIAGLILPESACLAVAKAVLAMAEAECLAEVRLLQAALADEKAKVAVLLRELKRFEEAELEARKVAELRRKVTRMEEAMREREVRHDELRRSLTRLEEAERERAAADDQLRALITVEAHGHHGIHDLVDL